jgi:Ser/Thr protein kinase RdoA (MazF antagonist)
MALDIAREVADKFFKKSGDIKLLFGERNPNYLVTTKDGKFVLKIHSVDEVLQLQIQQSALAALENLVKFQTPITVPATSGELLVDIGDGKFARMLSWIDGDLWSQSKNLSDGHKIALGKLIATVDIELGSVDVAKYRNELDRPFGWNALQVQSLVDDIELINYMSHPAIKTKMIA